MTNANPLTENELQAAAYFAVGVTSEGSIAGRDLAYRLSFAGNVGPDGRMRPVANSGYSFGTMQVDLGQHPAVARDLLDHYQAWAATQPDRALEFAPDEYETSAACAQECEALDAAGKTFGTRWAPYGRPCQQLGRSLPLPLPPARLPRNVASPSVWGNFGTGVPWLGESDGHADSEPRQLSVAHDAG